MANSIKFSFSVTLNKAALTNLYNIAFISVHDVFFYSYTAVSIERIYLNRKRTRADWRRSFLYIVFSRWFALSYSHLKYYSQKDTTVRWCYGALSELIAHVIREKNDTHKDTLPYDIVLINALLKTLKLCWQRVLSVKSHPLVASNSYQPPM